MFFEVFLFFLFVFWRLLVFFQWFFEVFGVFCFSLKKSFGGWNGGWCCF